MVISESGLESFMEDLSENGGSKSGRDIPVENPRGFYSRSRREEIIRGLESGDRLPKVMSKLREPRFIDKSPEFLAHLMETQGEGEMGLKFWIGFEEDLERETRIAMKAEGPDDIADRMAAAVRVFNRYGSSFLSTHPKGRLVVWASTHTDGLSPLVRKHVLHKEITESPVIVADYGGGLVIDIDPKSHTATTTIAGEQYPFPLEK